MKITELYQLESGHYPNIYDQPLTPETMAQLTEFTQNTLEGFFGAPSSDLGSLLISPEQDMSWNDIAECMEGSREAIIPIQYRNKWLVNPKIDMTDAAIKQIIAAMEDLKSRHGLTDWDFRDEQEIPFKTLDRFARLKGYILYTDCLIGQSQGEELDVLHILPIGHDPKETTLYHEVAPYWEGNAFCIQVILHSPFKGTEPFNEMLGFVVGRDQYVLTTAVEMVTDAILAITKR